MRNITEIMERLAQYKGAEFIYTNKGFIAWQCSTGENYEILFIEASEKRQGYGKDLLRLMVERIRPYHSVFVFRLASNEEAGHFYRALGFEETLIKGLYRGQDAVLGIVTYNKLVKMLE